jgi:hypothetical protein
MDDFEIAPVAARRYPPVLRAAMVLRWYPTNDPDRRVCGGLDRLSDLYCFCTALVTRSAKETRHDFSLIQPNSRTGKSFVPFFKGVCPRLFRGKAPHHGVRGDSAGVNQHQFIMACVLSVLVMAELST